MRRLSAILLIALLLTATVGITVHKHYCESALVGTTVLPHDDYEPCDPAMPMDEDSCRDVHELYAVDSPLVLPVFDLEVARVFSWLQPVEFSGLVVFAKNFSPAKLLAGLPPPPSEPRNHIRVQAFLL